MGIFDTIRNLPTTNELVGSFGEWLAKIYAKTFPGALVLHDILIDGSDQYTSQIDLVIIGGKGIYVVEVKMYTDAKIYGNVNNTKWYYYNKGKKYEIYNVIKQNKKHIEYMKNFLKEFNDVPFFSIITMVCEDFKISGTLESNTIVCNSLPAMERAIYKIAKDSPEIWDEAKKQEIFNYIKANQHTEKEARKTHKENVIAYKKNMQELTQEKKCPYCKSDLIMRKGKYGEFWGCANYPKCKFTMKK